jgi:hypothetical protein
LNSYWMRTRGFRKSVRYNLPVPGLGMAWGVGESLPELAQAIRGLPEIAAGWPTWETMSVRITYTKDGRKTKVSAEVRNLEALRTFIDGMVDVIEAKA